MSKLTETLRAMGVYNNHSLVKRFGEKGCDVWIEYAPYVSRGYGNHCSKVHSPGHQTNPGAHWTLHGCKSFSGTQRASMPLAVAWASERYGIDEWAPSPFGGKVPAYIRKAAERAVKEAMEQSNASATE